MAILTTLPQEGGESKFYEIPDDQLQQYSIEKEELTEDKASSVLGGGGLSKDKAEGTMPAAAMSSGSDVQAYSGTICYIRRGRTIYWWYC